MNNIFTTGIFITNQTFNKSKQFIRNIIVYMYKSCTTKTISDITIFSNEGEWIRNPLIWRMKHYEVGEKLCILVFMLLTVVAFSMFIQIA